MRLVESIIILQLLGYPDRRKTSPSCQTQLEPSPSPSVKMVLTCFELVTKVVLPEEVKDDLCNQSSIGLKLFTVFIEERIQTGKENLWSPMKKQKLLIWKTTGEKIKVSVDNNVNVVELQEATIDVSLLA